MPYKTVADRIHTKKLCSRLSSSEVEFYTEKRPFCVFEPPLGDLRATCDVHLRLMLFNDDCWCFTDRTVLCLHWCSFCVSVLSACFFIVCFAFDKVLLKDSTTTTTHWKARGRLPITVNWTFFARCYGWGISRLQKIEWKSSYQISIENRRFRSNRISLTQNFRENGRSPPTILLARN